MKKGLIIAVALVLVLSVALLCACAPESPEDLQEKLTEKGYSLDVLGGDEVSVGIDLDFQGGLILSKEGDVKLVAFWCADAEDADTLKRFAKMLQKHEVYGSFGVTASGDEELVVDTWGNIFYMGTLDAEKDFLG